MLNLLFISDSPKAEQIKNELQPLLKVIIDVVTDFDRGMKDVFEKRPATVCIQDHIGGVTGESVARHIQMLLGGGAPTFILFHTGNAKAREINGLFENLVDLSLSHDSVIENLLGTLKLLLGDNWKKIYIPLTLTHASVGSAVSDTEELREYPDKPVAVITSDLEAPGNLAVGDPNSLTLDQVIAAKKMSRGAQSESAQIAENSSSLSMPAKGPSANDEIVKLLQAEAKKSEQEEYRAQLSSGGIATSINIPDVSLTAENKAGKRVPSVIAGSPEQIAAPSGKTPSKKPVDPSLGKIDLKSDATAIASPPALPAEEFRISKDIPPFDDHLPEGLLLAFEENYRSKSLFMRRSYIIVLVFIVCVAGGWYLLAQKPQTVKSLKQRFLPSSATKKAPVVVTTTIPAPKPVELPLPLPVVAPVLPSFIPKDGIDPTFSQKKPGWNRYVDKQYEYRVFSTEARIQAIQVLSNSASIPESLIKSVMQELTGSSKYQILSQTTKDGVRVETGKVQNKGEVILYRKNGSVKAFVVSVN
ncbi:MAG: hypothetical protein PHF56_02170 [Desulfuromonadaceae bacterium]|nr:hypothetical protein [Desulfuromonadaceae bacterium]